MGRYPANNKYFFQEKATLNGLCDNITKLIVVVDTVKVLLNYLYIAFLPLITINFQNHFSHVFITLLLFYSW